MPLKLDKVKQLPILFLSDEWRRDACGLVLISIIWISGLRHNRCLINTFVLFVIFVALIIPTTFTIVVIFVVSVFILILALTLVNRTPRQSRNPCITPASPQRHPSVTPAARIVFVVSVVSVVRYAVGRWCVRAVGVVRISAS